MRWGHKRSVGGRSALVLRVLFCLLACQALTLAEHVPLRIFTSADGLGSSFVDFMMRDSRGFMWFCTRDGLSRFDGSQFITYKIAGQATAPGFESIAETRDGLYWVSTTGGTFYFDSKSVPSVNAENKNTLLLDAKLVTGNRGIFFEDRDDNLWLASGKLFRVQRENGAVSTEEVDLHLPTQFAGGNLIGIDQASDGCLWLTSNFGLIRRYPDGRVRIYPSDKSVVNSFLLDKDGRVWLGRGRQLTVLFPKPWDADPDASSFATATAEPNKNVALKAWDQNSLPQNPNEILQVGSGSGNLLDSSINHIYQSSDGTIWFTTESELVEIDRDHASTLSASQGLPPSLRKMQEDPAGNLWIAGQSGLTRLDRQGLTAYGLEDGLRSRSLYAVNQTADGEVYVASGDFFLSQLEKDHFESVRPHFDTGLQKTWTSRFIYKDSRGDWWFLTRQGLYRYSGINNIASLNDKSARQVYGRATGLKADEALQIFEDSQKQLWVSFQPYQVEQRGLVRFDAERRDVYQFSDTDGFPSGKSVSAFAEDKQGNIWIGFLEGGMVRYSDGKFSPPTFADDIPAGIVTDLMVDRNGCLWIASAQGGLYRIENVGTDSPKVTHLTIENGLASNNIRTITEDSLGNIYAGTVRGVDRVTPDEFHVKHYSVNDGLASDFVVDSLAAKDGTIWFATTNGLSRLIPVPDKAVVAPQVRIGGLRVAGEEQNIPLVGETQFGESELSSSQNNLQIEFYGLDFRTSGNLRYQYKLEGGDGDWSAPTDLRAITFANLQPATYRFLVRAVSSDGAVSENPAVVSFKILQPIWRRWWFIAAGILLLGAIGVSFYRYRISNLRAINTALVEARNSEERVRKAREERLVELEKVRTRIATDLHDDIGASLTQIAILSEVARQKSDSDSDQLSMIYGISNELVGTMSDIVWAINPQKDQLHDLTLRMRRFASDVFTAKDIDFEFDAPEDIDDFPLNSTLRREVFLIFKEVVNNIVKHSQATEVEIALKIDEKELCLNVKDNGTGFDAQRKSPDAANLYADQIGGNGLPSLRRRAEEMNGEIEINSEPGTGTSVTLRLPVTTRMGGDTTTPST